MPKAKWTVMVLMGANNVEGERDLSEFAKADLREMKQVGSRDGVLNIVVQIDDSPKDGGPRRIEITPQGEEKIVQRFPDGKGSAGDPSVLGDFLRWAKTYPAEHYLLVLWGHAYRLAFNRGPNNTEGLDFIKLAEEIDKTNKNGSKLDIVAFDSCNVSLIEAAYQLRNSARVMVASQFTDPLPGWPYKQILKKIVDDQPDHMTGREGPKDFARAIVSQFVRHYIRKNHVTMTALDLSRMDEFPAAIERLSSALVSLLDDPYERDAFEDSFQRSQVPGPDEAGQPSVDLISFCWHLIHSTRNPGVAVAAAALSDLLFFPRNGDGSRNPFIVAHGRNDVVVSMLQGVSIFAPNVVSDGDFAGLRSAYEQLALAKNSPWADLVFELADQS